MIIPEWTINKITALENYRLKIDFVDGITKIFDCTPLLEKKFYTKLKDKKFFQRVFVSCGGAAWNDEIDISPEYLFEKGINI